MDEELLLENLNTYITLTKEEEQFILQYCIVRRFKRAQFLNVEGEVNRYTNFITKGSCRVYYIDPSGQQHVVQLGISKWWVGDFPSFIMQTPATMYTEALEPTQVISISYDHLQIIYEQVPKVERFFRLLIQKAYAGFHHRVLQSLGLDAEERYKAFRNTYPEMDMQVAQKHIASYLGISPEFLSTIKKRIVLKARDKFKQSL